MKTPTPIIYKVERIGSEDNHEGLFLINEAVQVKYVTDEEGISMEIDFNPKDITEQEANDLAQELLRKSINKFKEGN